MISILVPEQIQPLFTCTFQSCITQCRHYFSKGSSLLFVCLLRGERTQGVADPGSANKAIPDPSGRGRPAYRTCTLVVPPPQHGQLPGWERHTGQKPGSLVCKMDRAHRLGYPHLREPLPPCGIPSVACYWRTTIQPGWGPEVPAQVVPRTKLNPSVLGIRMVL